MTTIAELILLSMLLFAGFCAVILVWAFFDIFINKDNKKPLVATATPTHHNNRNSRV
jgi:hypothetical protein